MPEEKESESLLSVKQVAKLLNLSTVTIYRKLTSGELSKIVIGRRTIRVTREELEAYKARNVR